MTLGEIFKKYKCTSVNCYFDQLIDKRYIIQVLDEDQDLIAEGMGLSPQEAMDNIKYV